MNDAYPQTEETFRLIVEASPSAIVVTDHQGTITLVNAQTEGMFGYARMELIGESVEKLMPERLRARHPQYRAEFLRTPVARPMGAGRDLCARRKDGSEFPVEIGLNPIGTERGLLVLATIVDITERRRAQDRFRLAIESAPSGMVMVDRRGRIVLVNSQTEKMFAYQREDLIGREVEILVPERYRTRHPDFRGEFFAHPDARPMGAGRDLYGLRKDGSEFPVEIGLNPIETEEGLFALSAIVDITERKRAQDELARQARELARSNAELQEFAYVASHDLQEPLRAVAGFMQLFRQRYQGRIDARADEYIQHAVEGAKRMRSLIDDLLLYSRVGTRGKPFRPTDCEPVLDSALANLAVAMRESGAVVTRDPLPTVMADETQLTQVFQNLIGNAIKFRKEGAPVIHVGAARWPGGQWELTVRDNGIGIDPQYFERIFRVFQRLHTRAEYPGTGVGLAICKKVVERHGGHIWLESALAHGCTFHFTLPGV